MNPPPAPNSSTAPSPGGKASQSLDTIPGKSAVRSFFLEYLQPQVRGARVVDIQASGQGMGQPVFEHHTNSYTNLRRLAANTTIFSSSQPCFQRSMFVVP